MAAWLSYGSLTSSLHWCCLCWHVLESCCPSRLMPIWFSLLWGDNQLFCCRVSPSLLYYYYYYFCFIWFFFRLYSFAMVWVCIICVVLPLIGHSFRCKILFKSELSGLLFLLNKIFLCYIQGQLVVEEARYAGGIPFTNSDNCHLPAGIWTYVHS